VITAIAAAKGDEVTPSAVVLQWHLQRGITPVPRSTNRGRLLANLTPPSFALTPSEMSAITALGATPHRVCPDPALIL